MFKLELSTENAAFDEAPASEIGRILRTLADKLEADGVPDDGDTFILRDHNGNRVGEAWTQRP